MSIKKKTFNNKTPLSNANDKRGELLIKVDELMENLSNDYGPFLLDELQKRLEFTINKFHSDLKSILEKSFKNHDMKSVNKTNIESESDVPTFIAEYEEKIKKK